MNYNYTVLDVQYFTHWGDSMKKPLIGISGNTLRDTSGAYVDLIRSYVNQDYVRSIEEAGGIPIIIPFTENLE